MCRRVIGDSPPGFPSRRPPVGPAVVSNLDMHRREFGELQVPKGGGEEMVNDFAIYFMGLRCDLSMYRSEPRGQPLPDRDPVRIDMLASIE